MQYVRPLDPKAFEMEQFSGQILADRSSGSERCRIHVVRVPAGGKGPGMHVHTFDQFYYVLSGTMTLEVDSERYTAGPNTLVMLPAGVPHHNWNEGAEVESHIAILVPEPQPGEPLHRPPVAKSTGSN